MKSKFIYIIALTLGLSSCEKSLEIEVPSGVYLSDAVFENDDLAQAAARGMYLAMVNPLTSNPFQSLLSTTLTLTADECVRATYSDEQRQLFENNLFANASYDTSLWNTYYNYIANANMTIEGAEKSTKLSSSVKRDVIAEARFIRGISFFYLTNIFGSIPLTITSDYTKNASLTESSQNEVYSQVIADLLHAQEHLLGNTNAIGIRHRASRFTATALLARVYLYQKKWAAAEQAASAVIAMNNVYKLEQLGNVFLRSSTEAIWAISNYQNLINTPNANFQGPVNANSDFLLSAYTLSLFDANDQRKARWTKTIGGTTAPFKYKQYPPGSGAAESVMVIRLAELYLIRAEARAMQNNIAGAVADVDALRIRAGAVADNVGINGANSFKTISFANPDISKEDLIKVIYEERVRELFCEFGHRWFDAKRTTTDLDAFFDGRKPGITATDALFPIPLRELKYNKNLKQREGY